ncbi:MAG: hypothetical protein ACOC1S_04915 [bacterium]
MIPETVEEIKKCQHLEKSKDGEVRYCEYYAYKEKAPCREDIKKECLKRYHRSSCC